MSSGGDGITGINAPGLPEAWIRARARDGVAAVFPDAKEYGGTLFGAGPDAPGGGDPADPLDRLRIVPYSRTVLRRGLPIPLTRLEFDLLLYLTQRPRRVLPRRTLMAEVWGVDEPLNSRTVDVHIRRLRDKLGSDRPRITTVRGVGYRFDGPQDVVIDSAPEWAVV